MVAGTGIEAQFKIHRPGFDLEVDLHLPPMGVTGLFGPSGAGKTTLLRCLAGLERADKGRLRVNGNVWQSDGVFLPPERRAAGIVFQDTRLFRHLDVRRNLLYGYRRTAPERRRLDLATVVELLGLGPLLERTPAALSGGESQRVAIGRALLASPAVLLLDEPLAALDAMLKAEILPFFERLYRQLDIPIIFVSHDLADLTALSDTLVILDDGRVRACGPLVDALVTLDPVQFGEALAVPVPATVRRARPEHGMVEVSLSNGQSLSVPGDGLAPDTQVIVRISARDIDLRPATREPLGEAACLDATVLDIHESDPALVLVTIDIGGLRLLSLLRRPAFARLGLTPGVRVQAVIRHAQTVGGHRPTPDASQEDACHVHA